MKGNKSFNIITDGWTKNQLSAMELKSLPGGESNAGCSIQLCGADVCGVDACALDVCIIDACGIDIFLAER